MDRNNCLTKKAFLFFTVLCLIVMNTFAQESKPATSGVHQVTNVPDSIKEIPEGITIAVGTDILGGGQTKEILLANPFLSATTPWEIVSYRVVFVNNGVESPPINVQGANFPEEVISKIKSAPSGTMLEFLDIIVSSAAGIRNIIPMIMVRIK